MKKAVVILCLFLIGVFIYITLSKKDDMIHIDNIVREFDDNKYYVTFEVTNNSTISAEGDITLRYHTGGRYGNRMKEKRVYLILAGNEQKTITEPININRLYCGSATIGISSQMQ